MRLSKTNIIKKLRNLWMPPVPACNGYRPEVRGYVIYSSRATHEGSKSHNPSLQADNPYIKSFSPADSKEILLKDKVTKYLIQKFFKFLWPLLHKKFNIWHVSVKIRKKRPCLSSSSQTKGQLVGTIGCLWWKFIVMVNFHHEHSIVLTSCLWVSEDGLSPIMGVYFI